MEPALLLSDIKVAYAQAYGVAGGAAAADGGHGHRIRRDIVNQHSSNSGGGGGATAAAREDAKRQLEEHLSLLCTTILIGGEQVVRQFPSALYVPVLTDILIAAHAPPPGSGDVANPLIWDGDVASVASLTKSGKQSHHPKVGRAKEQPSTAVSTIQYAGFQAATPIELLALRALALIAADVPRGSLAMRTTKSALTIPVLAAYLADTEFLIINDELTEELLKCFVHITLIAHEACVEASVPRRIVELLLVVEQHHLRLLCLQILSNMLARSREYELEEVWTPVLALLLESLTGYLIDNSLCPEASAASSRRRSSAAGLEGEASAAVSPLNRSTPAAATAAYRTLSPRDVALLQHYLECVVHALDRLFIQLAALESHPGILDQFVEVCVQLLRTSLHTRPATDGETLRSFALSPLLTLYLTSPTFAVPLFVRLHVWDAVCGCMLALVERKQLEPLVTRQAAASPPSPDPENATASAAADGGRDSAVAGESSLPLGDGSVASSGVSVGGSDEDGDGEGPSTSTARHADAIAQRHRPSISSGPVLTADVTTIPFIADELRLLPLLEFLLVTLPCARREHSHSDYRSTTAPYYRWTWEDDFHNEMECNEHLCRRLERTYQQTRGCRTHGRFAMTHGRQRVFYADFLSKTYVSERKMQHSLHRRPILAGYVHDTQSRLLRGCACCSAEPDPLFTTWTSRSNLQLRTVDTVNGGFRATSAASGAVASDAQRAPVRASSAPSLRSEATGEAAVAATRHGSGDGASAGGHTRSHSGGRSHGAASRPPPAVPPASAAAAAASGASALSSGGRREAAGVDESAASRGSGRVAEAASARLRRPAAPSRTRGTTTATVVHDGDDGEENDQDSSSSSSSEDDTYDVATSANRDEADAASQAPRHTLRLGLMFCACGRRDATAQHRPPAPRRRAAPTEATSTRARSGAAMTVAVLPVEAALEDPVERLLSDPATRSAFLGKGVLSRFIPSIMPALLSVLDNCVNPLVARHSLTLLLRCLSLCADLRTQVTGESTDTLAHAVSRSAANGGGSTTSSTIGGAGVGSTATGGKDRTSKSFLSFRNWLKGGGGGGGHGGSVSVAKWQRAEWQATQTALQVFLTSLRDVFVSLYMTDGLHITASRQDVFGTMRDDLLMTDELARVHLAPEFFSFQLSLPSEQLMNTADCIVLLMALFPTTRGAAAQPTSPLTPDKESRKAKKGKNGKKEAQAPPQLSPKDTPGYASPSPSGASLRDSAGAYGAPSSPAPTSGDGVVDGRRASHAAQSQPPSLPQFLPAAQVASPAAEGAVGGRASASPRPQLSPQQLSSKLHRSSHLAASTSSPPHPFPAHPPTPTAVNASRGQTDATGSAVFTAHQITMLLNCARQVVSHSQRICSAASQIEKSMEYNEYKTVVVTGTQEAGDDGSAAAQQLESRELQLRVAPARRCPYHFSFSLCAEVFFDASKTLLRTLTESGGDVQLRPPVAAAPAASSTTSAPTASAGASLTGAPAMGAQPPGDASDLPSPSAAAPALPGDLPVSVTVSLVPETIDMTALQSAVDAARADAAGPYRRLAPALRALLTFYDYCKSREIELRAVMIELPSLVRGLADELRGWHAELQRAREDGLLTSLPADVAATTTPMSDSRRTSGGLGLGTRLDSQARGKILALVGELGAAVSRDLGLATLDLAPVVVVKQPCSFVKRAKRLKTYGAVRHLAQRPLTLALQHKQKATEGAGDGVVSVRNVLLPTVAVVPPRKLSLTALPNTTMASLAAAVARQLQLAAPPSQQPSATAPRSGQPAAVPLHAMQERRQTTEGVASPTLGETASPRLTSEESFEDGSGGASRAVSPDCVLLFINDVPMLSPLTTLLDALVAYAETGYSLRALVSLERQASESEEAFRNKMLISLPHLPFWVTKHAINFVVLKDPIPAPLLTGNALTSLWSTCAPRRCGCAAMEPPFCCSPRHLFDIAPVNGSVALYAAVSAIARSELADAANLLDSNQRRLSSAVVHQLYQQLNMFMLPPLMYGSGIGAAVRGSSVQAIAAARRAKSNMAFPLASYVLWSHPAMFSMEMRVSILRFFISAQRSLSLDHCRHVLQSNQGLLVRRAAGESVFAVEEGGAGREEASDRRLDIVGLEWLSEEVLRRRRVTLTVDRRHILSSAEQLFTLASCTLTLDVAFKGEAGIGNGPAMEFFELVAEELLRPKHGLFRTEEVEDSGASDNSSAITGHQQHHHRRSSIPGKARRRCCNPLYPAGKQTPRTLHLWELLGLVLGRLLMMGETTSLTFHPLLLRRLVGEDIMKTPSNLDLLDPTLASSLRRLTTMSAAELEACDLVFTIPLSEADGCSPLTDAETPMVADGATRRVTRETVDEYVLRLRSYYLQTVPDLALLYLRRGLQHVVNPLYLELFSAQELGRLFGSSVDAKVWESREQFARCIEAGHGYHRRSDVVQYLLDVVPQWSARLQHLFLKFVTGSSSVPYGGLTQTIKVVRRDVNAGAPAEGHPSLTSRSVALPTGGGASGVYGATVSEAAQSGTTQNHSFVTNTAHDSTLPTVSTCFLYLKLPQYSSKAVLEERLRFAVCEGSNFFSLT